MLLFKPYHVFPILDGIKTETRRTWEKPRAKAGSDHQCRTRMFSGKDDYFAIVDILDVYQQPLGEMTEEAARKEGGYTLAEYAHIWEIIGGSPLNPLEEVWVVEMALLVDHTTIEDLKKYGSMYREHMQALRAAA